MPDQTKNLDEWREKIIEELDPEGPIPRGEVDALIWFHYHSYADFAKSQLEVRGFSFSERAGDWLLTCRLKEDDTLVVAFVGSVTTTRCIQKLRKLLRGPGLTTYADKFA